MNDAPPAVELLDAFHAMLNEIGAPAGEYARPGSRLQRWIQEIQEALDNAGAPSAMSGYVDSDGLEVPGTDLDLVGRIRAWADDREGDEWRARQAGSAAVRAALLDRMRASRDLRLGAAASIAPGSAALRRYATMEESAVYLVSDLLPGSAEEEGVEP